jgi:hypothetical protein
LIKHGSHSKDGDNRIDVNNVNAIKQCSAPASVTRFWWIRTIAKNINEYRDDRDKEKGDVYPYKGELVALAVPLRWVVQARSKSWRRIWKSAHHRLL